MKTINANLLVYLYLGYSQLTFCSVYMENLQQNVETGICKWQVIISICDSNIQNRKKMKKSMEVIKYCKRTMYLHLCMLSISCSAIILKGLPLLPTEPMNFKNSSEVDRLDNREAHCCGRLDSSVWSLTSVWY